MSSWASPPGWHPGRSPEVLIGSAVEECANLVQLLWNFTSLDLYSGFLRDKCWSCYMFSKPFCDFIYHRQGLDILRNCCHTVRLLYGHMLIPSLGTVVSHSTTKCVWKKKQYITCSRCSMWGMSNLIIWNESTVPGWLWKLLYTTSYSWHKQSAMTWTRSFLCSDTEKKTGGLER